MTYLELLEVEFANRADVNIALKQKAYMRNQFECFGLMTGLRRELQKPFLVKEHLPEKSLLQEMVKILWNKPQREFQYFGQELVFKFSRKVTLKDIALYEYMVMHKSWWDTVDFIAVKLIGDFFIVFPEKKSFYVDKWLQSGNIWLQRCALLFQLKYKEDIDTVLLRKSILFLLDSKEFFINKAIGWILREYSRTNPSWVVKFVKDTSLSSLSKREALRLL